MTSLASVGSGSRQVRVERGDCRDVICSIPDCSIDACVTDPPYSLVSIQKRFGKPGSSPAKDRDGLYKRASAGFMGKQWDTGEVAHDPAFWAEVFRVLKPGAHLVAFAGTRTYHRMACAIEDAGFEIRDQIGWLYGSGFPKSHNIGKAIDRAADYRLRAAVRRAAVSAVESAGLTLPANSRWDWTNGEHAPGDKWWAEFQKWLPSLTDDDREHVEGEIVAAVQKAAGWFTRRDIYAIRAPATSEAQEWQGWGTALKPAWEPICLARKPLVGTVAENVLRHGCGALNIDGCRVEAEEGDEPLKWSSPRGGIWRTDAQAQAQAQALGRWPANLCHDGSYEVIAAFPQSDGQQRAVGPEYGAKSSVNVYGDYGSREHFAPRADTGSATRFFFSAKADADDRCDSKHPTVKPVALMRWLARLVTPPGGTVLDPFGGSGTTAVACVREGFDCIIIEREDEYVADIRRRLDRLQGLDSPLFAPLKEQPGTLL